MTTGHELRLPIRTADQAQTGEKGESKRPEADPNSGSEGREKQELTPDQQLEAMYAEVRDIKYDRKQTFGLGRNLVLGLQELSNAFGARRLMDAVKVVEEGPKATVYEVIKILEPDAGKRQELYQKMTADARQAFADFNKGLDEIDPATGSLRRPNYYADEFGPGKNPVRLKIVEGNIAGYAALDNMTTAGRFVRDMFDRVTKGDGAANSHWHIEGGLHSFPFDPDQVVGDIEKNNGDIVAAIVQRYEGADQRIEELLAEADLIAKATEPEIAQIEEQITGRWLERRAKLMQDISAVMGTLDGIETEEMGSALQTTLSAVEGQIKDFATRQASETESATKDLRDRVAKARALRNLYMMP